MVYDTQEIVKRFNSSYRVDEQTGCWLWCKSKRAKGYGQFSYHGRMHRAHRVSYILFSGEIPPGMHVLHRCDVSSCVNPAHLFIGSNDDNMRDRDAKNRVAHGNNHCVAKLSEEIVKDLRSRTRFHGFSSAWAREFGVSSGTITYAIQGKTWRRVGAADQDGAPRAKSKDQQ